MILVEGDAEYILFEKFFETITNEKIQNTNVHIISVGGTSFKRYMEVANLLNIKTAIIRDNDGDYKKNCVDNYVSYLSENTNIFYEEYNDFSTFEISIYNYNKEICDTLFSKRLRTRSVQKYMLDEKTESAYELLSEKGDELNIPEYIVNAISWLIKD